MTAPRDRLGESDRVKLIGILGRLGSDFDGERAAAGLLASKLIRDRGLTWDVVVISPPPPIPPPPAEWRARAVWCRQWPELLSGWEVSFVGSIASRRAPPTPKQGAILDRLVARLAMSRGSTP